ncbi:MAG TPA: peptidylprolyl isomerase, partial [Verrucomicrobiales bacterium]|nr:peptidylprolyl isomerase [Verrucomicrobiales bacterium]
FHRVIPGFMAQTGDPTGTGMGGSGKGNVMAEFSKVPFVRGTVGAARSQNPNSADSQFFICFATAPHLDGKYTVFAKVIQGIDVLDKLEKVPQIGSKPQKPVILESVTLIPRSELKTPAQ